MEDDSKLILILLGILLLACMILGLQFTGVINIGKKPNDETIAQKYESNSILENNTTKEGNTTNTKTSKEKSNSKKSPTKSNKKSAKILMILGGILFFCVFVTGEIKLYKKLGMDLAIILRIITIISFIIMLFAPVNVMKIFLVIIAILTLIISANLLSAVGISPWWALSGIIPYVGTVILLIVGIMVDINLGNKFNKGTGYKLGLIFLPFIFYPMLGFEKEDEEESIKKRNAIIIAILIILSFIIMFTGSYKYIDNGILNNGVLNEEYQDQDVDLAKGVIRSAYENSILDEFEEKYVNSSKENIKEIYTQSSIIEKINNQLQQESRDYKIDEYGYVLKGDEEIIDSTVTALKLTVVIDDTTGRVDLQFNI